MALLVVLTPVMVWKYNGAQSTDSKCGWSSFVIVTTSVVVTFVTVSIVSK